MTALVLFFLFQNCSPGFSVRKLAAISASTTNESGPAELAKQSCSIGVVAARPSIYRKNKQLIQNAIVDILGADMSAQVSSQLQGLPSDYGQVKAFEALLGTTNDEYVNALSGQNGLADKLSSGFVISPISLQRVLGTGCEPSVDFNVSKNCFIKLKENLIEPLFGRRLLSSEEDELLNLYKTITGTSAEKLTELVFIVFSDPRFLYADKTEDKKSVLLRELSRLLWYSVPSPDLIKKFDTLEMTDEQISTVIDEMMADPKSQRLAIAFFKQWFAIDQVGSFTYPSSFVQGVETKDLRAAMILEADDFLRKIVLESSGSLQDLFSSQVVKTKHPGVAAIYQTQADDQWHDAGETRKGILSRSAVLANDGTETRTIMRGVRIYREFLCNSIGSPPTDIINMRNEAFDSNGLSTRQIADGRVASTKCMGCHSLLNPLAHGFGTYDSLGRYSNVDRQYNSDGTLRQIFPLEPGVNFQLDGKTLSSSIGADFVDVIAHSHDVSDCFSRQFYRFLAGQLEKATDSCGWQQLSARAQHGVPIRDLVKDLMVVEMRELAK